MNAIQKAVSATYRDEVSTDLDMTTIAGNAGSTNACYDVSIYTTSSKPANDNHRLSVIQFKTPKDKKEDKDYKRPVSRCVSIPKVKLTIQPDIMADALQASYNELQDQVIRSIVVNHLEAGAQDSSGKLRPCIIEQQQISLEACAAFYARQAVGTKLSKDLLETWFDSDIKVELELALIAAFKFPDTPDAQQQQKLDASIKQHRDLIAKLAASQASMPEQLAKQLKRAVALAEETPIKTTIIAKLDAFMKPQEQIILEGLGE